MLEGAGVGGGNLGVKRGRGFLGDLVTKKRPEKMLSPLILCQFQETDLDTYGAMQAG